MRNIRISGNSNSMSSKHNNSKSSGNRRLYRNKLPFWMNTLICRYVYSLHHSMVSYFHIPSQCISRTPASSPGAIHMCTFSWSPQLTGLVHLSVSRSLLLAAPSHCVGETFNFQCLLLEIRLSAEATFLCSGPEIFNTLYMLQSIGILLRPSFRFTPRTTLESIAPQTGRWARI